METLPVEVIFGKILPYLRWNDLLRLRLVSDKMKKLVNSYIGDKLGGIPEWIEVEINETNKNWRGFFETFLTMGFPASKFYLNNTSGSAFFLSEQVTTFRQAYGSKIRHLRVHKFPTSLSGRERSFYESLENLASLQIEKIVGKKEIYYRRSLLQKILFPVTVGPLHQQLPSCFENLKVLHIRNTVSSQKVSERDILMFNVSILDKCLKLEELTLGTTTRNILSYTNSLLQCFFELTNYIEHRAQNFSQLPNLKYFDFQSFVNTPNFISPALSVKFLELCMTFVKYEIKMRNVPAVFFKTFQPQIHPQTLSSVVESLDGIHPSVLEMELFSMSKLSIWTFDQKSFLEGDDDFQLTTWPALEELFFYVDRTKLIACKRQGQEIPPISVAALFPLLFEKRRTSLKTLVLQYYERMRDVLLQDPATFPCPRVASIVSSCPNITTLKIVNWPGDGNLSFSAFWTGLESLEEVYLEKCKLLSDRAFTGDKLYQPAFLQLKNLKRLSLIDLDKMPNITDMIFILILRHMKLKKLILTSGKPLKNVTKEGISSLISGEFSKSVVKFPFSGWSLANVGDEEWEALQSQFPL